MGDTQAPAPKSPCRLTVYLAPEAPVGVVLRRGPTAWARLSLWHTDTDAVEHGQWLKGRVYERRCDVSADGALFAAFTQRLGWPAPPGQKADSWLAISRPPWFTALALWFVGGTYYTGALFADRRTVWTGFGTDPPDQGTLPSWLALASTRPPHDERTNEWTERTVYVNRLLRDGWHSVPDSSPETWERRDPSGHSTLVMTQTSLNVGAYGGRHISHYTVRTEPAGAVISLGRATWADWDQHGRLVLAQRGRLLHWQPDGTLREIADFNPHTPTPEPSPPQARAWPRLPPLLEGEG